MQKHSSNVFLKIKRLFMNNIATSYPCTLGKTYTGFLEKKKNTAINDLHTQFNL
jgi:hypothetical protein